MSPFLARDLPASRSLDFFLRHFLDDLSCCLALEHGRQLRRGARRVYIQRRAVSFLLTFEVARCQQFRAYRFLNIALILTILPVRCIIRMVMMARFDRVILLVATRTVGRTGRVIWRADRKMRARGEALRVRRQSTVRASFMLRFELRVDRRAK